MTTILQRILKPAASLGAALGIALAGMAPAAAQSFNLGNGVSASWIQTPNGVTLVITNHNAFPMVCEILSSDGRWVRLGVGPGGYVYMENPRQPLNAGCYR
ncbi:MAG: hypothetical protein ACK4RV_07105 [Caulobacter sp.]